MREESKDISVKILNLRYRTVSILAPIFWAASMSIAWAAESKLKTILENTIDMVRLITELVWVLTLVVFGWGIVKLISASGSPEKLKEAKGIIWWGIIGMFVLASIIGIIVFAQEYFGIHGVQIIDVPQF